MPPRPTSRRMRYSPNCSSVGVLARSCPESPGGEPSRSSMASAGNTSRISSASVALFLMYSEIEGRSPRRSRSMNSSVSCSIVLRSRRFGGVHWLRPSSSLAFRCRSPNWPTVRQLDRQRVKSHIKSRNSGIEANDRFEALDAPEDVVCWSSTHSIPSASPPPNCSIARNAAGR